MEIDEPCSETCTLHFAQKVFSMVNLDLQHYPREGLKSNRGFYQEYFGAT